MSQDRNLTRCWQRFKERVKNRWTSLRDSDLDVYQRDFNQLTEQIRAHCDESRDVVRNFIDILWFEIYVQGSRQRMGSDDIEGWEADSMTAAHIKVVKK
ncbi:MAG: hypothetical protein Q8R76_03895 [Candidatus Omnitrophota bacterium]|nr:hypothetical protein [Candidatus Omnitrophota bacterium]